MEPAAVVEPTNELKAAQVALKVEEQRIYRELSQMIRKAMPEIKKSLEAAAAVSVYTCPLTKAWIYYLEDSNESVRKI